MTKHLAESFGEVHGTDVSAEMIERARLRFEGLGNAFFYETNGLDFSALPNDYFDIIFSVYVFQHVPTVDVIYSNIRAACRVLKPGGLFKFQTCGITAPDYEKMRKDTWTGASFTESDIRRAARENGVQLMSILGLGTQYCWTILRKHQVGKLPAPAQVTRPRIEFFGRSDAPQIKAIPTNGDFAYLTLIVSGYDRDVVDANSLVVEINGRDFLPCYAGWVGDNFAEALRAGGATFEHLTQLNIGVQDRGESGTARVRIKHAEGEWSEPISLELLPLQPIAPKINLVSNSVDGGVDLHARGEKSVFRIHADGMDDQATPDNVRVLLGENVITPISVSFAPANGVYITVAKMPEHINPGETEIRIQFRDLISESARILILG
jgi:SAM-dependent methyltransferase